VARIKGGSVPARVGVRVPGIYSDLLRRERESGGRADAAAADRARRGVGARRSRHLLDALEAGEAVTVSASQLVGGHVRVPVHMRPGRTCAWWRVTPDDAVVQADSPVVDRARFARRKTDAAT
jgi:hypothetical protein